MQKPQDDSIWRITQDDRQTYEKIFTYFDQSQKGFLTDEEMKGVIVQTKLPKEVCKQVWEMSNPSGDEVFTKPMFMVAIHFMYKKKKDSNVILPN
jgi:Ca2+-binding EF-hand superfamily protein